MKNNINTIYTDKWIKENKVFILEESKKYIKEGTCTCHAITEVLCDYEDNIPWYKSVYTNCNDTQNVFHLRKASQGVNNCNINNDYWFPIYDDATLKDRLQLVDNAIEICKKELDEAK